MITLNYFAYKSYVNFSVCFTNLIRNIYIIYISIGQTKLFLKNILYIYIYILFFIKWNMKACKQEIIR